MFCGLKRFDRPLLSQRSPSSRPRSFRPRVELLEERQLLSTIFIHAGDNLQAILTNVALPGDTLVLDAGATFVGPITLPNKTGNQWITIQSSRLDGLPGPGRRVSPEDAALMPKIVSPGLGYPALQTKAGAHNYRLDGIEFLPAKATAFTYDLITLGDGSNSQTSLDQVPHDLILDQCYIHAWPRQNVKRGIALNSAETSILNSYIAGFKSEVQDSQAISGWNGPGPYHIVDNYLEAAGENILFGGDRAWIPNLVPSDIEILRNDFLKPLSWKAGDPSFDGTPRVVKNLLELKNARQVLIEGNLFENNWVASQDGFAIVFTVRDQNRSMPWAAVEDVTFQNNLLWHVAGGFVISGKDNGPSGRTRHIVIRNNVIEDIGSGAWGTNGNLLEILNGANDIVVDHNTAFPTRTIVTADGVPSTGFVYRNNITTYGAYGIVGSGTAPGNGTLGQYFPGAVVVNNVLAGGPQQVAYPAGNFFPASLGNVGFVDLTGGDFRLAKSSSYKNGGTDGKDLGADIDALLAAMNPVTVPQAPSGLTAIAVSPNQINLAWNGVAGATAYKVERSPDGSSGWVQSTTEASGTTFRDTGLMAGATWFYRVRAANAAGSSAYSDPANATTPKGGAASRLRLTGFPSSVTAGIAATFTIAAADVYGNAVTGYLGTVHFSSSDPQAVLPADYTFTAADKGVHTFSATLHTLGLQSLTATDNVNPGITGTQAGILVVPGGGGGAANPPAITRLMTNPFIGEAVLRWDGLANPPTEAAGGTYPDHSPANEEYSDRLVLAGLPDDFEESKFQQGVLSRLRRSERQHDGQRAAADDFQPHPLLAVQGHEGFLTDYTFP